MPIPAKCSALEAAATLNRSNEMTTKAERFNELAKKLLPNYDELLVENNIDSYEAIDELLFRREGEYIGGMATTIIAVLKKEGE